MKTKLIRIFDKVIFKVLTLLGCAGLFAACYGVYEAPYETQVIRGTVTDGENGTPIEGIQISLKIGKYPLDTVYTDKEGAFRVYGGQLDSLHVKAEDVDGERNGGHYLPDSTIVNYRFETEEGDRFHTHERTANFKLGKQK